MSILQKFLNFIDKKVEKFGGARYRAVGFFGIINYPLAYFILPLWGTNESFTARLCATLLCVPLIFTTNWPVKLKKYLNLYWFISLLYCFPIFGAYSLLNNQFSTDWLINFAVGMFILFLLVDYVLLLILYSLGFFMGYLLFILSGQEVVFQGGFPTNFIYLYSAFIIIGCLYTRNKERLEQEKFQSMKVLAGAIAHEMRTPLLGIGSEGMGLEKVLPSLITSYNYAIQQEAPNLRPIPSAQLHYLSGMSRRIQKATEDAFVTIDMLLMNLKGSLQHDSLELYSINNCIKEALEKYPLDKREKQLVRWQEGDDFQFIGNPLFLRHVFFNLLKNALFYVKKAGKGHILIKTAEEKNYHVVHFKDTGPGIDNDSLDHIFDRFYTKTSHGTGIGLAFCKKVMEDLGGDITCSSVLGEFTEFKLRFPK